MGAENDVVDWKGQESEAAGRLWERGWHAKRAGFPLVINKLSWSGYFSCYEIHQFSIFN